MKTQLTRRVNRMRELNKVRVSRKKLRKKRHKIRHENYHSDKKKLISDKLD